jgi:hypothetical protein
MTSTAANSSSHQRQQQQRQPARSPSAASFSSSSSSSSTTIGRLGRTRSFSAQSINSTMTSASTATTRAVSISGGGAVATIGTLHCKPTEPMLVLFTRNCETGLHGIVAISLEPEAGVNYEACRCTRTPRCQVSAVEMGGNRRGSWLPVLRLGGVGGGAARSARWDILPLADSMKGRRSAAGPGGSSGREGEAWRRVIRVTMCFETVEQREEFGGLPCTCPKRTEGELSDCLLVQGHRGRLGFVREYARRELEAWYTRRHRDLVHVVDQPGQLGVGRD